MTKEDITTRGAVRTRYHGPTNCKGSRISATNGKKTIYQPYNHSLNENENHCRAAQALLDKIARFNMRTEWKNNLHIYLNDTFIFKVDGSSGLAFAGDYFWTWDILGKKEEVEHTVSF